MFLLTTQPMHKALVLLQSNVHQMVHFNTRFKFPACPSFSGKSVLVRVCSSKSHGACYLESINGHIDAHLSEAIPIRPPLSVFEPLHHLTFAAPRSTAPALCVAACELVGGNRDRAVVAAASAIHLMHASFFTHEQLRSKDGANPILTNHISFGPNIKLLTGDAMMPFALELLANSDDLTGNSSERIVRVIIEITRMVGSHGMIQGNYHEIVLNHLNDKIGLDENWIDYVCEKKEGGLYACAAACGAMLGGGNEEEIEKVRKYGYFVGMIQGIMNMDTPRGEKNYLTLVEEMRNMALRELKDFSTTKVELISSFLHPTTH